MRWLPSDPSAWRTLIVAATFEFGLGAAAWAGGHLLGVDTLKTARFTRDGVAIGVVATIPLLLALVCMMRWPLGPFARLIEHTRYFAQTFLAPCGIIGLGIIAIGAGVGEELLTRGLIHTFALRHLDPILALVITGVVFGLMHPISPAYVAVAGVIGIYLGIVWQYSGPDLVAPVAAHALYDFVALLVLCRRGMPQSSNSV